MAFAVAAVAAVNFAAGARVSASVGGVSAEVTYAGLVPGSTPGLQQFNVLLPPNVPAGSAVSIQLSIDGVSTQTGTTVAIAQ